jgi:ABC-type lipopolysaccharide export system ATPase subunit
MQVLLNGITKSYAQGYGLPPVAAIAGMWLRVWPGECFGLLGVNGAGDALCCCCCCCCSSSSSLLLLLLSGLVDAVLCCC